MRGLDFLIIRSCCASYKVDLEEQYRDNALLLAFLGLGLFHPFHLTYISVIYMVAKPSQTT